MGTTTKITGTRFKERRIVSYLSSRTSRRLLVVTDRFHFRTQGRSISIGLMSLRICSSLMMRLLQDLLDKEEKLFVIMKTNLSVLVEAMTSKFVVNAWLYPNLTRNGDTLISSLIRKAKRTLPGKRILLSMT